ncbi:hypothetical protein K435DRAFT_860525 [Dendrothele bispora CBS 962.96]|uniref:DUF4100 domain-containing protein n=1 Tax=Dendrothele bispora (strain CBS 962.96) TaxID=1314807 RepID=A0A4S8LZ14_DENBC|nr:hypothetical protein K435DRAFT_860525 [Dendrothele bispora CBS 962.96]
MTEQQTDKKELVEMLLPLTPNPSSKTGFKTPAAPAWASYSFVSGDHRRGISFPRLKEPFYSFKIASQTNPATDFDPWSANPQPFPFQQEAETVPDIWTVPNLTTSDSLLNSSATNTSIPTSTSLGSTMATTTFVCVPMPIPGAPGAPVFNGDRASDFLVLLEQLGTQAGITDKDLLVEWIVRYSTIDVRDTIQWMEEFDPEEDEKTWDDACECLKNLYASRDKAPQVTRKDLENFCKHTSETNVFSSSEDVDGYRIKFMKFAAPLVKNKKISKEERNYYFVTGLPNTTLEWFHNQLTPSQRYVTSAPSVDDAVKIIKQRYDHNTIFYKPWTTSADKSKRVRFDLDGQRIDPSENKGQSSKDKTHSPSSSVDDLAKQFKDMRINQASMNSTLNQLSRALRQDSNPTVHSSQGNQQPPYEIMRRCFICGETNTHPMHPSRCHLMPGLLQDNVVIINPNNQRYLLPTGNDLPKLPREPPPHMGNSSSNAANVSNIGLSYGGVDVFSPDVFVISALDTDDYYSYPTLRSGRDTSRRFDPKARPRTDDQAQTKDSGAQPPRRSNQPPQQPVPSTSRQPPQVPAQRPIEVPQPNNPINREEGWKASKPLNTKGKEKEDVSMKDGTKKGPSYYFTSTLSEKVDTDLLYNRIIDTEISIPIGHLLGTSPDLQKKVSEATRTKREYKTKAAEFSFDSNYEYEREDDGTRISSNIGVGNIEELPSFLVRYSNTISTNPEKFYGMVTGKMDVTINGVSLTAMIDSGSELNLMGKDVPDRVGLPVDFEGMKWTLRGISGGPERLKGVVTDVPLMIGKHEFSHHHFIANYPLENQDIILGQPFLTWFAARMEYARDARTKIFLWKDGDKSLPPTLSIMITDPTDKRNTTVIDRNAHPISFIEDEEDF